MDVICFTTSDGESRSIRRLWMRISKRSQVLVPSPHGDLRTVSLSFFVGRRTGPLTFKRLSLAPLIKSAQTFSRFFTLREVRVILILCRDGASTSSFPGLDIGGAVVAILTQ